MIGNEQNSKQCHYYKNTGREIEKCRKRQYNNSRNNSSGNSRNLSSSTDGLRWARMMERMMGRITSGECNRDSEDGTGERECRVVVINPKKLLASPITIISVEETEKRITLRTFSCLIRASNPILSKQKVYIQTRKPLGKISCILSL